MTNGLRTAEALSDSGVTVVLPGGTVRRSSWSVVGDFGDLLPTRGRLAMGFFGLRSLSVQHGLMELTTEETVAKRQLAAACAEIYGLFDSSKIGRFALYGFAPPDRITGLITDEDTEPGALADFDALGIEVQRVPVDEEDQELAVVQAIA